MKVCKIWDADYPWDIRVEKVARSLADSGHVVDLVCRNGGRRCREEESGGVRIHRLPSVHARFGALHDLANFPYPVNPVWIGCIARVVRRAKADVVLVRDLPLAPAAVAVARAHGLPVVLDMAENYPAMLRDRLAYTPAGLVGRLVRNPRIARAIERMVIRMVDHIIVVVEESAARLAEAGVPPERLTIVSNTPPLARWTPSDDRERGAADGAGTRNGSLGLVYLGNVEGSRGLDVAIRGVRRLKDLGRAVTLYVVGDGPMIAEYRELARTLDVADRVTISGRQPFSRVRAVLARADIGLIPHHSTEAWNSTIPNKLFDYMLLRLPVVVSDSKPTARIVEEEACGEVFRSQDVADFVRCVLALEEPEVRRYRGARGRSAVLRRYNWDVDGPRLVRALETVAESAR